MEGSDEARQRIEHEARVLAEQKQREKAEQAAIEQAAATGAPLPDPNSDPGELDPQLEKVQVPCAGCQTLYEFEIAPDTKTFKFKCRGCGTKSEWKRV